MDRARHCLTVAEYEAAERLRRVYGAHARGAREATAEWNAIWMRTTRVMRMIVWSFVLEQPLAGEAEPMSYDDFGRRFVRIADVRRARGATDAAIKLTLEYVAATLSAYDAWRRSRDAAAFVGISA